MGNEFARLIEVVAWQLLNRSNSSLTASRIFLRKLLFASALYKSKQIAGEVRI
jgi:hypothetical protein